MSDTVELAWKSRRAMSLLADIDLNRLLAPLPVLDKARLAPSLELVPLRLGELVSKPGERMQYAWFPTTAIISLHNVMASGASAEIASVGNDGLIGISLFMGGDSMPCTATVSMAGQGYRVAASVLKREFLASTVLRDELLCYSQALMTQVAQTAACNRHHTIGQQLCRYLLSMLDRLSSSEMIITQELVAGMLGVRREGITAAVGTLQRAGLIHCRRGHVSVLDRTGLERLACECYAVVSKEVGRLRATGKARQGAGNQLEGSSGSRNW
jgi:CRP-like cAMP-binding protein